MTVLSRIMAHSRLPSYAAASKVKQCIAAAAVFFHGSHHKSVISQDSHWHEWKWCDKIGIRKTLENAQATMNLWVQGMQRCVTRQILIQLVFIPLTVAVSAQKSSKCPTNLQSNNIWDRWPHHRRHRHRHRHRHPHHHHHHHHHCMWYGIQTKKWYVLLPWASPVGSRGSTSHLASWLRTRRFREPTFRPSWANFPTFSPACIFFLLTFSISDLLSSDFLPVWASSYHLSILSEDWLLKFLRICQGNAFVNGPFSMAIFNNYAEGMWCLSQTSKYMDIVHQRHSTTLFIC